MNYGSAGDSKKHIDLITHTFPLRLATATHHAVCATVAIPANLTTKDAERLSIWLKALAADWPPESAPAEAKETGE